MRILIINLAQCLDRRSFQEAQAERLGLEPTFLKACCKQELEDATYHQFRHTWERPMSRGEVACFLSHRQGWAAVAESGEPALILEDDTVLADDIKGLLNDLSGLAYAEKVNLGIRNQRKVVAREGKKMESADYQLFRLHQERSGAHAYVLWPEGATKLLKLFDKKASLADKAFGHSSLIQYQIEPAAAVQTGDCQKWAIPDELNVSSTIDGVPRTVAGLPLKTALAIKTRRFCSHFTVLRNRLCCLFSGTKRAIAVDPNRFTVS